ncbi:MAG: AraC family transcriptional regulator [Bacteroidales bacterium]|jgi:AraC-like DNA-binding protein|nr:AraC family transcriptional regulator [Bacteroidales bacterium]
MTARLIDPCNKEVRIEIPDISFCGNNETKNFIVENKYINSSSKIIRSEQYAINEFKLRAKENTDVYLDIPKNDFLWFRAVLQGRMTCENCEWEAGQANLFASDDNERCLSFEKGKTFRMLEIMLTPSYLEQIAQTGSQKLSEILDQYACKQFSKGAKDNIYFCPRIGKALNDLMQHESLGSAAAIYIDAKIREIIALFLCQDKQKDCVSCNCYKPQDKDLLLNAKSIIEKEFLNPPSLHRLALMVGTNECKIKNGFRKVFGTTVFGYLFDYRMDLACKYLLETDKTIQEIASMVGYEHHSHFSTAFKRKFNMTPAMYRERMRQG